MECPAKSVPVGMRETGVVKGQENLYSAKPSTTTRFHSSTGIFSFDCRRFRSCHCVHILNEYSIKTRLLAAEPLGQCQESITPVCKRLKRMVGERGFEPPTPWSRTRCSTRLSHSPTLNFHLQPRDMKRAASWSARLKKVSGQPAAPCGAASNARRSTRPLRIRNSSLILSQLRIFRWSRRPRRRPVPRVPRIPAPIRPAPSCENQNGPPRLAFPAPTRSAAQKLGGTS